MLDNSLFSKLCALYEQKSMESKASSSTQPIPVSSISDTHSATAKFYELQQGNETLSSSQFQPTTIQPMETNFSLHCVPPMPQLEQPPLTTQSELAPFGLPLIYVQPRAAFLPSPTGSTSSCEEPNGNNTKKRKSVSVTQSKEGEIYFNSKIESLSDMIIFQNNWTQIADFYFDFLCYGFPLLPKHDVFSFIFNLSMINPSFSMCEHPMNNNIEGILHTEDVMLIQNIDSSICQKSKLLLFFSIMTFTSQRLGKRALAKKMFDNTWRFLQQELNSNSHHESNDIDLLIHITGSFVLLCYYALSELGDIKIFEVNWLMKQVNIYFAKLNCLALNDEQKQKVYIISKYMTRILFLAEQIEYLSSNSIIEEKLIDSNIKFYRRTSDKVDALYQKYSWVFASKRAVEIIHFLNLAQDVLISDLKLRLSYKSESYISFLVKSFELSFIASKIQVLLFRVQEVNRLSLIEKDVSLNSDYIANLIRIICQLSAEFVDKLSIFYHYTYCPLSIHYLSIVARFYLFYLKFCEQQGGSPLSAADDIAMVNRMEYLLMALQNMQQIFGFVDLKFKGTIMEIQNALRAYKQRNLLAI
jgi:hypothetical protein